MISKNQISNIRALHLKKNRDLRRQFLAEGIKTVVELIDTKAECISEIFATNGFIDLYKSRLISKHISYTVLSETELEKISLQTTPNKVLCVCNYFNNEEKAFDFDKNFALYLDDVRDPGNFGTIIRLANWFGISTVFCSPQSCDFYNPKAIQASMGAFIRINCVYLSLTELLLKHNVNTIYGAVLNGENMYKKVLKNGLILIGNEANGISANNLKLITQPITIPCHSTTKTESLNAAMATSIIVAEFYRQLIQIEN